MIKLTLIHLIIIIIIHVPLFIHQCHEQEIPEVIPIEGIPFSNQSKSNQLNLTQHKSNVGFWGEGKTGVPREKPLRAGVENQQTQPTYDAESENRTRATLVGGECSNTAPTLLPAVKIIFKLSIIVQSHTW